VVAGLVAIIAAGIVEFTVFAGLKGLSIDSLFALRHTVQGNQHTSATSPTVVVAIDEETYRRPGFSDVPKAMWTKHIAKIMNAVLQGGAKVVGYDVIFPTSVERYIRGFDREFLVALRDAARKEQVVLGKVQHQAKPISPFAGYSFAVGHEQNIRSVNVFEDDDGVIRRIPLLFRSLNTNDGERIETSMALELAARASNSKHGLDKNGNVVLGQYLIPDSGNQTMLLNFQGGSGRIPSYSLADLAACAEQERFDYFQQHFAGKVVLIGAVLDVEDRKLTSKRYTTEPEGKYQQPRCVLPVMTDLYRSDINRDTIPGVYIHATAINNLLNQNALGDLSRIQRYLINLATSVFVAILVMWLSPLGASAVLGAWSITWAAIAIVALNHELVLPLFSPIVAASMVFVVLMGYRFAITDRDKRYLRKSFSFYLPPTVVDRLAESHRQPDLGGETRELTAFFSDITGFTSLSEHLTPRELVKFLNVYLSVITDTIEEYHGFVDKYVGDTVVGVFGAPLDDPEHAINAVKAALACQTRLAGKQLEFGLPGDIRIETRIGLSSGQMLVGNIGSRRRFNYTVMGDAVNLASRLEGVNKMYGTGILVSDRTAELCESSIVFREVDRVRVVGKEQPVTLFEPRALRGQESPELGQQLTDFAHALAHYRAQRFEQAEHEFLKLGDLDPVARIYAQRIQWLRTNPLSGDWDGVTDITEK